MKPQNKHHSPPCPPVVTGPNMCLTGSIVDASIPTPTQAPQFKVLIPVDGISNFNAGDNVGYTVYKYKIINSIKTFWINDYLQEYIVVPKHNNVISLQIATDGLEDGIRLVRSILNTNDLAYKDFDGNSLFEYIDGYYAGDWVNYPPENTPVMLTPNPNGPVNNGEFSKYFKTSINGEVFYIPLYQ